MQWPLAGEIAHQQEPLRRRVPQYKGKIADQPRQRLLAPAVETFEQNRRIAKLLGIAGRQAKLHRQFFAIVETHIGNKRKPAVAAVQRLAVMAVFRERSKQPAAHRQRTATPLPVVVSAVNSLCGQHARTIGSRFRLAVETPNASKCAHLNY